MRGILPLLVLLGLALSVAAGPAAAAEVRKPRAGTTYTGSPGKVELTVGTSGLDLVAFSVRCGTTTARAALNGVALKRTRRGYALAFRGRAGFTYADDEDGANGSVTLTGRFSTTAKSARGTVRVRVARCGTRTLRWTARQVR
ncbi:MAG TPA: hypothetical protein VN238_04855 [Solirubrobacteraceae bacterium]|nr:hypothetical protein [Solirubrobacteraceae bacterium]